MNRGPCQRLAAVGNVTTDGERVFQLGDPHEWGSTPQAEPSLTPAVALLGFLGLCLLLGLADIALLSGTAGLWYASLAHPAGALPPSLFRPIWGLVYLGAGVAAWLVWRRSALRFAIAGIPHGIAPGLRLWGWSLAAVAVRSGCLFGGRSIAAALFASLVCAALLGWVIHTFYRQSRIAAWLMVPSLLWTGYLIYLSVGLLEFNPA